MNIKPIALGYHHSMAIGTDGNLYAWGTNNKGQLGIGNTIHKNTPQLVNLPNGVQPKSIALGDNHSVVIGSDDKVYAWGENTYGQLGNARPKYGDPSTTPVRVAFNGKPKYIAVGRNHSTILDENGDLYVWGANFEGQLGVGIIGGIYSENYAVTPRRLYFPNGLKIKSVSLGEDHTMAIAEDGNLYAWGYNGNGQLGLGNRTNQTTPQLVTLPNGVKPKSIFLKGNNSIVLGNDDNIYACGDNRSGEVGINKTGAYVNTFTKVDLPNNIKPKLIEIGWGYSMVIGEDNNLYAWGSNAYNKLGLDTITNFTGPQLVTLPNGIKPKVISLGYYHSIIMGENGEIYAWGNNSKGQLGIGNTTNQSTPTKVTLP